MGNLQSMFSAGGFDANTVEPAQDFAAIPSGEYPAIINDSAIKPTKNKTGEYAELTHQIIDGPYKGRLVWARLNLVNSNAQAQEIARRQFSSICHAAGKLQVQDTAELHNIPLVIRVEFVPAGADGNSKDTNEVKAWKSIKDAPPGGTVAAQPGAVATPAQGAANGATAQPAKPVWLQPGAAQ